MTTNLTNVTSQLSKREQLLICAAVNMFGKDKTVIHRGLLPFLDLQHVLAMLTKAIESANKGTVTYANLRNRLKELNAIPKDGTVKFTLYLDDGLVCKRFGTRPELGRPLHGSLPITVTAGLKWNLGKRDFVPDTKAQVHHTIALKLIKRGTWEVTCHKELQIAVTDYLMKYCIKI